jgi:hypothetical protein
VEEPRKAQLIARYEAAYEGTLLCIIRIDGGSRGWSQPAAASTAALDSVFSQNTILSLHRCLEPSKIQTPHIQGFKKIKWSYVLTSNHPFLYK